MQNLNESLDKIFIALSNTKRRNIITALALQPSTVAQLARDNQLSLPAIHKHLLLLESANMIQRKKVGRVNFIALSRKGLTLAKDWLLVFRVEWGSDNETLENYIAHLRE